MTTGRSLWVRFETNIFEQKSSIFLSWISSNFSSQKESQWRRLGNLIFNLEHIKDPFSGLRQSLATESPLKIIKSVFYFLSYSRYFYSYISFLYLIFCSNLQYIYCPISQELKATRQWNLVSLYNIQNVVSKLVPDPFLKDKNLAYLWISSLKFYTVYFYCMSKSRTTKIY